MKRLCTLALIAFAMCGTMNAEIVETYNAPTNFQAINTGENTIFWFTAPAEGGIVWNSTFSYDICVSSATATPGQMPATVPKHQPQQP